MGLTMALPGTLQIAAASTSADLATIKSLWRQYWDSFGFEPSFQNFDAELTSLPGKYERPEGRLALASVAGQPAGCVALRRLDAARCEIKRLYVKSEFRGSGAGKTLLEWVIAEARLAGYLEIFADTMPVMERAIEMYRQTGFELVGPYAEDPTPGAVYLRLKL